MAMIERSKALLGEFGLMGTDGLLELIVRVAILQRSLVHRIGNIDSPVSIHILTDRPSASCHPSQVHRQASSSLPKLPYLLLKMPHRDRSLL